MPDLSNTIILPQISPRAKSLARGLVFAGFPSGKLYGKTVKDLSGYGYDVSYVGTDAGADRSIDSRLGPVFQVGSSSKRYRGTVNEPAQQSGGPWTLMSWVKPNTLAMSNDGYFLTYRNFGSHYPLNLAMIKTTGVVSLIIVGAGDTPTKQVSGSKGMTAGKWTHACGVYVPSSKIEIYFDGILDTTNTTSIPSAAGTWTDVGWNLGGPQSDSFSFDGWMAHCYVWNRALTAGEVRLFYDDPWILFRYDLVPGKGPGANIFTFSTSDAWTEADASAYQTNSLRATSDTWADADTSTHLTDSYRAISDTWTLADAFSVTMGVATWTLSIIETWLVADSAARVSDASRTASDTWLLADSWARIADGKRNPIDSINLTADTFDRLADAFRVITEPVLIVDNAKHWNTYKRAFSDTWTESDATAAGLVMLRRIIEAVLFADSSAIATTARRALSDTITLADSLSRVVSFKRQTTDTVSISDSMARIAANLRAIQDSISVAASTLSRVADGNRQVTDSSLVIADAFKRISSAARRISDSLVVSDTLTALATRIVATVDAWLAADSVGRSVASKRTVSDSFTLADSARKLIGWLRSVSDSIVVSDAVGRKGTAKRTISDTLAMSDDARAVMAFARRILESILVQADTLTRSASAKRSVSDAYAVRADIVSKLVSSARSIVDALAITDAASRHQVLGAAIVETLTIADSTARKADSARQIADALKVADAIARLADANRGIVDYVSVSDSVRRIAVASRQIADTLAMPDGVSRVSNAVRAVADAFGVRDAGATIDLILQLLASWLASPRPVVWRAPPRGIAWMAPPRRVVWKPKSTENMTMPVVAKEQLEKQPDEAITYAMDFSELLDANELSTTEALSSVSSVAASPSGLTLGSGSISGDRVTFSVSGGTDGTTYRIEVTVTTSTGNTRVADGMLIVKD